jgi:ferredoxin-NADP reductase
MGKHDSYDSKLLGSEEIARATRAFHFEKPEGFTFTPCESIDLFLPEDFPGATDDRQRSFSIASAPHEDRLTIATRMRKSAYKQPLAEAQPGAAVRIVGPKGTMSLHDEPDRAIVMIAGGIGITPFISVLRSEAQAERPRPMALIYSNRRPEDAAYLDELRALERRLDSFRLIVTMTGDSVDWDGETRRIDADMVKEASRDLPRPHYYIAGTPDMCEAMRQMLDDMGIADDDILSEDFTGYT